MSVCSISLCPWKYYLASGSFHLFETFSQLSCPNSKSRFLSFLLPAHYPQTPFRKEQERGFGGGENRQKPSLNQERQRQMEWMYVEKGENGTLLWTWPLLVVLMNGEARAGTGDKPDKSVFVAALQMRRNSDRFTSHRKALRSATLPPHTKCSGS